MALMFSKCESDILHGVSLQLSTSWSLWFTSHAVSAALYKPQKDRRGPASVSLLVSAKHGAYFATRELYFFCLPSFTLSPFSV